MYNAIILDDETFEAKCIAEIINWKSYGFNLVKIFNKPTDVLPFLETNKIDIIFSDIKMPFMDGLELCEKVKELYPDIMFVIITAHSDFSYAQKAIRYGVMDYLVKPITYSQLDNICTRISQALNSTNSIDLEDIDISFLSHQQIISNYLSGIIGDDQLNSQLKRDNTDSQLSSTPVAITKIKINNFFEYLKYTWKHGIDRFYSFFMTQLSMYDLVSYPLDCSFDTVTIITFSKGKTKELFPEQIEFLFSEFLKLCFETLKITLTISDSQFYESISSLKKSESNPIKSISESATDMNEKINLAKNYVKNNYMNDISVYDISELVGLSPYYFYEHFKKSQGISFTNYITQIRVEQAKTLLIETNLNVADICQSIGFNTKNYFFKIFKDYTGLTPKEFRATNRIQQ